LGEYEAALSDSEAAIRARPDWAKGYFRKGSALQKLKRHEEAFYAFFECLSIETATKNDVKDAMREAANELFIVLKRRHCSSDVSSSGQTCSSDLSDKAKASPCWPKTLMQSTSSLFSGIVLSGNGGSKDLDSQSLDSGVSTSHSTPRSCSIASLFTGGKTAAAADRLIDRKQRPINAAAAAAPEPIVKLVNYASLIYEKQSNLEQLVNTPAEDWFLRGILTYRRPYRNIPDSQVDAGDYECPLCYRLLWQPVTTACGHTYCKVCLEQALDHNVQCPLCKSSIVQNILTDRRETVANEFIECSMRRLLPKEYEERKHVHYCEIRENEANCGGGGSDSDPGAEPNVIPVFVCTISAPNIPCPLHIFEPRYRLMIRRAMESGTREFGMACKVNNDKSFADYGTMLEIRDVQYLSDGRSIIDTVGGRRFRVLERGTRDGYNTAKVDFVQDEMPKDDEVLALQRLHDQTFWKAGRWFAQMGQDIKAGILMHYGNLPEPENYYWKLPNGPTWIWWLLVILPLAEQVQVQVLSQISLRRRLEVVAHILRLVTQPRKATAQGHHQRFPPPPLPPSNTSS